MQVTSARIEDCLSLAEIHVASWQAAYVGLFPAEYLASLSVAERQARWQAILKIGASRNLIAKQAEQVVGFVSFGRCRDAETPADRAEVWALYVAPHAWSTGAGWALWEAARVQMLHAGFGEVSLWVLSGNARGLRFYEAVGFRREPHSEKQFEQGGAQLEEVKLVFEHMSANPSIERTCLKPLRAFSPAAHVER